MCRSNPTQTSSCSPPRTQFFRMAAATAWSNSVRSCSAADAAGPEQGATALSRAADRRRPSPVLHACKIEFAQPTGVVMTLQSLSANSELFFEIRYVFFEYSDLYSDMSDEGGL